MIRAVLIRIKANKNQTLGRLFVFDGLDLVFKCCTLELPDRANMRNISCIPTGIYEVKPRTSAKYKEHFEVTKVLNRKYILIHPANYYTDLKGCIGVGADFYDINKDGEMDITSSRDTMSKILELMPNGFNLTII